MFVFLTTWASAEVHFFFFFTTVYVRILVSLVFLAACGIVRFLGVLRDAFFLCVCGQLSLSAPPPPSYLTALHPYPFKINENSKTPMGSKRNIN